jgi:Gpi18-like mannosyltransferase
MKKRFWAACIIVLCAVLLLGCVPKAESKYGVNILKGGESGIFNYNGSLSELRKDWTLTSGGTVTDTFSNASNNLTINTSSAGWATVSQKVNLKPNSYYKVSYTFSSGSMSAKDITKDYDGLWVGFLEDKNFNRGIDKSVFHKGATDRKTQSFYFKTGNVREATLAIYIGSEERQVSVSSLVISDISLTRVEKDEATQEGVALYDLNRTTYGRPTALNNAYVIVGGIMTLIIAYAFYMLRARSAAIEKGEGQNRFWKLISEHKYLGLLLVIGVGFLVRFIIVLSESLIAGGSLIQSIYHGFDLGNHAFYGVWLGKYGMPYFFQYNPDATFMPFALYFDTIAGLIARIGEAAKASDATIILTAAATLKMFAVAADIGTAVIIYKLIADKQGKVAATLLAGLYTLLPVTLALSAAWGSMVSIAVFFAVLSFYFLLNKNYIGMACAYFVAALTSPAMLLVCPFVLFYTGLLIYRGIKEKKLWGWLTPTIAVVGGLILFYLITLPFAVNEIGKGEAFFAFDKYIETVKGANVYTANAFNFQGLLGNNFKPVTTESTAITIFFVLFILGLWGAAYFKSRSRLQLVMLASAFAVVYWYFTNNLNPASLFIALPLMFIYTALVKDKRLYLALVLFAAMMFVNIGYVNMVVSYDAAGIAAIPKGALMYTFGALNLLLVIYFIVVAYDSIVNNKTSEFLVLRVPYLTYVSSVAANAMITTRNFGAKVSAFTRQVVKALKEEIAERKEKRRLTKQAKEAENKDSQNKD